MMTQGIWDHLNDRTGIYYIANGLGHLDTSLIEHKAVGEHALVGSRPCRCDASQQTALKPACSSAERTWCIVLWSPSRTLLICFIHPFIQSLIWSLVDSFNHSFIHSFLHASIHSFLHSSIHSFFHSFNHLSVHSCVRLVVCWDSTFPQHLMHEAISIPCMRRSCLPDSCSLMSPCNSTTPWQSQAHSQQAINCVPPLCSFFTHALGCRVLPWFCTVKIRPITNLLGSSCPVESAVSCDGQSVILTSMLV